MSDLGERLIKAAVALTGGAIQRRQIANELKPICALVEEMLEIAKRSYGVALTASHMGHIAYEHNVTILDLSSQLATLKREIRCWVMRSSQDATAAMILAEENVVMVKANQELRAQVQQRQDDQRRQTERSERSSNQHGFWVADNGLKRRYAKRTGIVGSARELFQAHHSEISANPT
jgi:hypothetical protein